MSNQSPLRFKKTIESESKEITLNIDHDQLNVFMSIIPKTRGRIFEVRQIYEMLDNEGILNGVKRGVIADLIAKVNDTSVPVREEIIARGTPITPGRDAEIKYHFKVNDQIQLVANDEGKVNHRELNLINNVEKGELLAEKIQVYLLWPELTFTANLFFQMGLKMPESWPARMWSSIKMR